MAIKQLFRNIVAENQANNPNFDLVDDVNKELAKLVSEGFSLEKVDVIATTIEKGQPDFRVYTVYYLLVK